MTSPIAERLDLARRELVAELRRQSPAERVETMFRTCIETGGNFIPHSGARDNETFAEIDCLGIYHSGEDMPDAIAGWIKAVERSIAIDDKGRAA